MWQVREAFFAIADCSVPVVGAIHGAALGTGVAIAASCDFVVAAEDARFGLPELTVGVMRGARHLARMQRLGQASVAESSVLPPANRGVENDVYRIHAG